jgi:hypothetical protein
LDHLEFIEYALLEFRDVLEHVNKFASDFEGVVEQLLA